LSDLVRSCQILSHVHWAGLFEQSKSSICGLFQMPVLSRFVVSYQSKGGPVTFEFLGVTSDMDWYEVHGAGGHARCVQGAGTWAFVKARTWANTSRLQCESQHCWILVLWSQTFRSRLKTSQDYVQAVAACHFSVSLAQHSKAETDLQEFLKDKLRAKTNQEITSNFSMRFKECEYKSSSLHTSESRRF
jgi:hypothetical protein